MFFTNERVMLFVRCAFLALYCAVIAALPGCSSYTYMSVEFIENALSPAKPAAAISDEEADVTASLTYADESLGDYDAVPIQGFSVTRLAAPLEPVSEFLGEPHYIEANEARYQAFTSAFPGLAAVTALALVNINADYGYYNKITVTDSPEALLVLCNKNFRLPEDYEPEDLRPIKGTSLKMTDEAAAAFEAMQESLRADLGLPLVAMSAFRSYRYQRALYGRHAANHGAAVADTFSARAGHSEHQAGLAVDFLHRWNSGSLRSAGFQNTAQYAWLQAHAHIYGFILRYPEGYESITGYRFEPWHWRYIGAEDATRMFEGGFVTFEEYIGTYYWDSL
jgi:LAS superfamily LD-carboxypeptidase LdcB